MLWQVPLRVYLKGFFSWCPLGADPGAEGGLVLLADCSWSPWNLSESSGRGTKAAWHIGLRFLLPYWHCSLVWDFSLLMTGFLDEIQVKASLEVFVIFRDALFSRLYLECCFPAP